MVRNIFRFIFLFLACIMIPAYSGADTVSFEYLSLEHGLSQSSVLSICQDQRGFMWFGTYAGLNRYDGYAFEKFQTDPENHGSLSNNAATVLYLDRSGNLWIGTDDGLNRFDKDQNRFTRFEHDPDNSRSLCSNTIRSIHEDSQGNLWVGTFDGGLHRFNRNTGRFTRYHVPLMPSQDPRSQAVSAICEDSKGNLWVASDAGLFVFDRAEERFIKIELRDSQGQANLALGAYRLLEDSDGWLWIGTWGNGIYRYHHETKTWFNYRNVPGDPYTISNNIIECLLEDYLGNVWIGTRGGGLNRYDFRKKQFESYRHNPQDATSLSANIVLSLFEDQSGILWIGTEFGGLSKVNLRRKKFMNYTRQTSGDRGLYNWTINSIVEGPGSGGRILWIATNGGGLCRFDRTRNSWTNFTTSGKGRNRVSYNVIKSMVIDHAGNLLLGLLTGLDRFHPERGLMRHWEYIPENPLGLSDPDVFSLMEDREGRLWIGTYGGGVNLMSSGANEFYTFPILEGDSCALQNDKVWCMLQRKCGQIWIGTAKGLHRYDAVTGCFKVYTADGRTPGSLSNNKIQTLYEDSGEQLWIGTNLGLNRYDEQSDSFLVYRQSDGLASDVIQGILDDAHGHLWISTTKGLSRLNRETGEFSNYYHYHGLQNNEFCVNACVHLSTGELVFGGISGFNIFHPDSIHTNPFIPPVVITDFRINNQSVPLGPMRDGRTILEKPVSETESITLSYLDDVLSFEFASLHFCSSEHLQYAYKMEGFDQNWNEAGNRRYVTYSNLPPGRFTFRVRGTNSDGVWNNDGSALRIVIRPPFWHTVWFRVIFILAVVMIFLTLHRLRVRQIQHRRDELIREVQSRTAALERSNDELKQFASVASHDLQEPIRVISSYVKLLARRYKNQLDEDANEFIEFIVESTERMYQLTNDLLHYSYIATQGRKLEPVDCEKVFKKVMQNLRVVLMENEAVVTHNPLPTVMGDRMHMERLFQCLIGNGVKYRKKNESPHIHVSVKRKKNEWLFTFEDHGIGIHPKYHEQIFGLFQKLHTSGEYKGTGIGLALCRKIIDRHGGRIWVKSEEGQGATFYFTLPDQKNADGEDGKSPDAAPR